MSSTIVVVDDLPEVRELVRIVLAADPTFVVLAEAADGQEAVTVVDAVRPRIVVMDIELPHMDGLEATRRIVRRFPSIDVVMLSTHEEEWYARQAADAGARGYVVKRAMGRDLITALVAVSQHERYISPALLTSRYTESPGDAQRDGASAFP